MVLDTLNCVTAVSNPISNKNNSNYNLYCTNLILHVEMHKTKLQSRTKGLGRNVTKSCY